jgi:hypothetical protein
MPRYFRIQSAWLLAFCFLLTFVAIHALRSVALSADNLVDGKTLTAQFTAIEQRWLSATARNDRAAIEKLVGDDFIGTAFGGNVIGKNDLLPEGDVHEATGAWATAHVQDLTVHAYINSAVVVGRVAMQDASQPGFRFTKMYMMRNGRWQLVAAHLSHVENP